MRPLVTLGNIAYLYVMKHLTALLAAVITFAASAQQMPYNPDVNADAIIGVDDVLGVLGLYDTALMQPDLQCDYEGTDLEQWVGDLFNLTIELDSVYVEYLIVDSVQTFLPGCPDPVIIETILERSYMINTVYSDNTYFDTWYGSTSDLGYDRNFSLRFSSDGGTYSFRLEDWEIQELTSFDYSSNTSPTYAVIPFPEGWELGENGIEVTWSEYSWVANSDFFRLIPFWHEAE